MLEGFTVRHILHHMRLPKSSCHSDSCYSFWGASGCLCFEDSRRRHSVQPHGGSYFVFGCCVEGWMASRELRWFNEEDNVLLEVWKRDGWSILYTTKVEVPNTILVMLQGTLCWFLHVWGEDGSGCILFGPRRQGGILKLECIGGCCHWVGCINICFRHVDDIFVMHALECIHIWLLLWYSYDCCRYVYCFMCFWTDVHSGV